MCFLIMANSGNVLFHGGQISVVHFRDHGISLRCLLDSNVSTLPNWQDIYGKRLPQDLPAVPAVSFPYIAQPRCPDHCSGKHEVDRVIGCKSCKVPGYQVWLHEWPGRAGIYWSEAKAINGMSPCIDGQVSIETCPLCDELLVSF